MHEYNSGKKPSRHQCNQLLDAVVKIMTYKKRNIDYNIYIKVFYDRTVSYLTIYNDDVLNTTNNES